MEETINFQEIMQAIKKRIGLIIAVTLIAIISSAIITFFILSPQYEASTQILVNQPQTENEELSSTNLQSSRELISTYNVIITSPAILETVIEESNFEGSLSDLRSKITVTAEEESQVATVTVDDDDPQNAVKLANTLAQTFEQEIPNIMEIDNVSILAEAQIADSETPVSPQPLLNLTIALVAGLMAGVGIAFLMEFLDKSIKTEEDIEKELNLTILGVIPVMTEQDTKNIQQSNASSTSSRASNRETGKRLF